MKFRTVIRPEPADFNLTHRDRIVLIGSCFTDHIGRYLSEHWFDVAVNPFGTLYNSRSIRKIIERVVLQQPPTANDLFRHENTFKSFDFPSRFNRPDKNEYLENIRETLRKYRDYFSETNYFFITLGTAQIYRLKNTGETVANCHKVPAREFDKTLLTIEEISEDLEKIRTLLHSLNPSMKIILTISPVRYLQDGFTANTRSKARLAEAVFSFVEQHPGDTLYFPAYEIFIDDLRDYRFYAVDLKHPGEQGILYIREFFEASFFDEQTQRLNRKIEKINALTAHRTDDEQTLALLREKHKEQTENLLKEYPWLKPF